MIKCNCSSISTLAFLLLLSFSSPSWNNRCAQSEFPNSNTPMLDTLIYVNSIEKAMETPLKVGTLKLTRMVQLPQEILKLKNLRSLILFESSITRLPDELIQLENLTSIEISYSSSIPTNIRSIPWLKSITLKRNSFTRLPSEYAELPQLTALVLHNKIPIDLEKLNQLRVIYCAYMSENEMNHLLGALPKLENLKQLHIFDCYLPILPEKICRLQALEILSLEMVNLDSLPECIGELSNLNELEISFSNISSLPESLSEKQFQRLILERNTLFSDEITYIQQCFSADTIEINQPPLYWKNY